MNAFGGEILLQSFLYREGRHNSLSSDSNPTPTPNPTPNPNPNPNPNPYPSSNPYPDSDPDPTPNLINPWPSRMRKQRLNPWR